MIPGDTLSRCGKNRLGKCSKTVYLLNAKTECQCSIKVEKWNTQQLVASNATLTKTLAWLVSVYLEVNIMC